jgi:hypothetical protein
MVVKARSHTRRCQLNSRRHYGVLEHMGRGTEVCQALANSPNETEITHSIYMDTFSSGPARPMFQAVQSVMSLVGGEVMRQQYKEPINLNVRGTTKATLKIRRNGALE